MRKEGKKRGTLFCLLVYEPNGPSRWKPVQVVQVCLCSCVLHKSDECFRIISITVFFLSRKSLNKTSALRRCYVTCGPERCEALERRADIALKKKKKKAFRGTTMPCR